MSETVYDSAAFNIVFSSTSSTPTWLQAMPNTFQWYQIPNTAFNTVQTQTTPSGGNGSPRGIIAYSGATMKASGSELFLSGGGHGDWCGNEVLSLRLANNVPAWVQRRATSNPVTPNVNRYADGRPVSRHTGMDIQFSNETDRMFFTNCCGYWQLGNNFNTVEAFNPTTNDWDHLAGVDYPDRPNQSNVSDCTTQDSAGNIWVFNASNQHIDKFNPTAKTWTQYTNSGVGPHYLMPIAYDPIRNRIVVLDSNFGSFHFNVATQVRTDISCNPGSTGAMVWCPDLGKFLCMRDTVAGILQIDPVTFATSTLSIAGTVPAASTASGGSTNICGRFFYSSTLKVIGYVHDYATNVYIARTG